MKLKNLFAITAIASALVLTGCKEEKKADAAKRAKEDAAVDAAVANATMEIPDAMQKPRQK